MTPKRIPIPSDLVLKVNISDLYDSDAEPITIEDVDSITLTFSAGGASIVLEGIKPSIASYPSGVTKVASDEGEHYLVVCLCTSGLRPGQLTLRSEVAIPDNRFHDNLRTEIDEFVFPIILV